MSPGNAQGPGIGQMIMVIVSTIVALIAALVVVPPVARQAGLFEKHIGYATAAAAGLIVIVAVRWFKLLKGKPAEVPPPNSKRTRRKR